MIQVLPALIDKQDAYEAVQLQIAQILADESANQQTLAAAALKDPLLWAYKTYTDRSNPWGAYLNVDENSTPLPIVNVLLENDNFPRNKGNITGDRSQGDTTYHIDVLAYGVSQADGAGHLPGDSEATLAVKRIIRLVRNTLMAGLNKQLQLPFKPIDPQDPPGVVMDRWISGFSIFQPVVGETPLQNVMAARITLAVNMLEQSPQVVGQPLEVVHVDVKRASDGAIMAEAEFNYPLP